MPKAEAALISDYRLIELVGQGQFAQVYCAVHRRTGQLVAIKQTRHAPDCATQEPFVLAELSSPAQPSLSSGHSSGHSSRGSSRGSSQVSSRAGHPNLVGCHAIGQTDTGYEFVLDYCEGGTLRNVIDQEGMGSGLSFLTAKSLISDILQGLAYLHSHNIIHGDLKPENVLLTYRIMSFDAALSGRKAEPLRVASNWTAPRLMAKIGDFGSARFVEFPNRSRQEIGSPTYAAPERFNGQSSYASDLYSVGVMLYELLLGDRPFSGSPETLRKAHQTQPVHLPGSLTPTARKLLFTALHKQPNQRFSSASAMHDALQQLSSLYQFPLAAPISVPVPSLSIQQSLTTISTADIVEPIEQLISLPQGCGIVTAKSFHLLLPTAELVPIAQFKSNMSIAVDPQGKWLIALSRELSTQSKGLSKGLIQGQFYSLSKIATGQAKAFKRSLFTVPQAETVQAVAISSRYWLRIRRLQQSFKTSLECFTRRGQFVGQFSLNWPIANISLTATPYQLIARTATAKLETLLISLKPFQVQQFPHYLAQQQVSALPWGYIASGPGRSLILDKSAELASILEDLPLARAIAPLSDRQIVLATLSKSNDPLIESSSSTELSSLLIADLKNLDLGIIF
ncbi:MAG: serine/threonine-protein kinase [Phormidesmis sp.]